MVVKLNGVLVLGANYTVTYAVDVTAGPQLTITVTLPSATASMANKAYSVEFFKHVGTSDLLNNQLANFTFTGTVTVE